MPHYLSPKPPPLPRWMRVAFEGTYGAATWAVVHWFAATWSTGPDLGEFETMVDAIATQFGNHLINVGDISTSVHFTRVVASQWLDDVPSRLRTVRVVDVSGATAGANESAQVCWLIDWTTTDGRRGGKPRSYMPGVIDSMVTDEATLDPADQVILTGYARAYLNAVNSLTSGPYTQLHMIDASFVNAKDYRATAHAFPIVGAAVSNAVATQRRRVDRLRLS